MAIASCDNEAWASNMQCQRYLGIREDIAIGIQHLDFHETEFSTGVRGYSAVCTQIEMLGLTLRKQTEIVVESPAEFDF